MVRTITRKKCPLTGMTSSLKALILFYSNICLYCMAQESCAKFRHEPFSGEINHGIHSITSGALYVFFFDLLVGKVENLAGAASVATVKDMAAVGSICGD